VVCGKVDEEVALYLIADQELLLGFKIWNPERFEAE
jgi:hypothetical protein